MNNSNLLLSIEKCGKLYFSKIQFLNVIPIVFLVFPCELRNYTGKMEKYSYVFETPYVFNLQTINRQHETS